MNAATRLALENSVLPIAAQLAGSLPLVELWTDLRSEWRPLDLVELLSLSRAGDQPQTPGAVTREVRLIAPHGLRELVAPPRAVLNLVGLAATLVDPRRQAKGFELRAPDGELGPASRLTLRATVEPVSGFSLLLPPWVEPTQATVIEASAVIGLNIRIEDGGLSLYLGV
jgi:hypothetical protein